MRPISETSAALRALDVVLTDTAKSLTDPQRDALISAVFKAICPAQAETERKSDGKEKPDGTNTRPLD